MQKQKASLNHKKTSNKKSPAKKNAPQKKRAAASVNSAVDQSTDEEWIIKFLCSELVMWLTNQDQLLVGHRLIDKDALVESEGLRRPGILDMNERYVKLRKMSPGVPFDYFMDKKMLPAGVKPLKYRVYLSESIPAQFFRVGDFSIDVGRRHSYHHFYLLKLILNAVDKQFRQFVHVLNLAMQDINASKDVDANPLARSAANLKYIVNLLKEQRQGYIGLSIPDLFQVRPESALMTYDLKYFRKFEIEKGKPKTLYTYMYSRETSQAFSAVLVEKLEQKLNQLETELKVSSREKKNSLQEMDFEQWLKARPKANTKQKMKLALQILDLHTEGNVLEKKVSWTAGDLILIYRALEQCSAIIPKLNKNKIGVALEILTGKSHLKYLNNYVAAHKKEFNADKVFEVKPDGPKRESIRKLVKQLKVALDELLTKIE